MHAQWGVGSGARAVRRARQIACKWLWRTSQSDSSEVRAGSWRAVYSVLYSRTYFTSGRDSEFINTTYQHVINRPSVRRISSPLPLFLK